MRKQKKGYTTDHPIVSPQVKVLNIITQILENKKRSLSLSRQAQENGVYKFLTNLSP
jgi:hypothetical protein